MAVILARRRGEPPSVHAFPVPDDGSPAALIAPCGAVLDIDDAEQVPAFVGAPCNACWMLAIATTGDTPPVIDPADSPASVMLGVPVRQQRQPVAAVTHVVMDVAASSTAGFAVSWRGREVHRVASGAAMTELDGGTLVIGLCGSLGWGPIENAPVGWPICDECEQIASEDDDDSNDD